MYDAWADVYICVWQDAVLRECKFGYAKDVGGASKSVGRNAKRKAQCTVQCALRRALRVNAGCENGNSAVWPADIATLRKRE